MKQWEIQVGRAWDSRRIAGVIESVAKSNGLVVSLKGSLRAFPGCVHWHFKKERQSGTIEVTMWPQKRRVWLSVQSGRRAQWIEAALPGMRRSLQDAMKERRSKRPGD
jgi:hypothetical protein